MRHRHLLSSLLALHLFIGLPVTAAEVASVSHAQEMLAAVQTPDAEQAVARLGPERIDWPMIVLDFETRMPRRVTALMWAAHHGRHDLVKALLAQGARAEILAGPETAAMLAVLKGHLGIVKTLFEAGADLNVIDNNGYGLMHAAATSGNVELIDWLMQQGLTASDPDRSSVTPLFCAAEAGQFAAVKRLWELTPDKHNKQEGLTALLAAAKAGDREMLIWLQAQGVPLNLRDYDGDNALIQAATEGHFDTLKFLAGQGLDLKQNNARYGTLLTSAVKSGNLELVKWLVEQQGADIKVVNSFGWTALHVAAYGNQEVIVRYLLGRGADPLAVAENNTNVLMLAAGNGRLELVKWLRQQARFNLEQRDQDGMSALQHAVSEGQLETVRYLIEAGTNPWVKTHKQENLLMLAAKSGNLALARWLQERFQFDLRATDIDGKDALYHAFDHQHADMLFWLAEQGGDLQGATYFNDNLFGLAAQLGYRDLTRRLWQTGGYDLTDLSLAAESALGFQHFELFDELMALGARPDLMKRNLLEVNLVGGHLPLQKQLLDHSSGSELLAKAHASSLFSTYRPLSLPALEMLRQQHPELFKRTASDGSTLLFLAAANNQYHLARWLVEQAGVNPKAVDTSKTSALDKALTNNGSLPLIKYLYDQGLRFSPDSEKGRNPLMLAVDRNYLPLVIFLHKTLKLPLDQRDKGGDTALSLAVAAGHQQVAAWLIASGASVTTRNNQGHTLVHQAIASKNEAVLSYVLDELNLPLDPQEHREYWQLASTGYIDAGVIQQLLKRLDPPSGDLPALALASVGMLDALKALLADPERKPSPVGRQKAFSDAIFNKNYEAAALLYRSDLFAPGQNTVLLNALDSKQMDTAEYLLEQGIGDALITSDETNQSVLVPLVATGNISMLKTLLARGVKLSDVPATNSLLATAAENNQLLMAEYLIQSGLQSVNPGEEASNSPLNAALARGHLSMSKFLLQQGADPRRKSGYGEQTSLEAALDSERPKLLESFAKLSEQQLNQTFDGGKTLMHRAAANDYPGWIVWLKEKGLAIDARDEEQQTPLMVAVKESKSPHTRMLIRLGARADAIDACQQGLIAHAIGGEPTPDWIRFLLEQGAPLTGKDCNDQTLVERFMDYQQYFSLSAEDQQRILELLTP